MMTIESTNTVEARSVVAPVGGGGGGVGGGLLWRVLSLSLVGDVGHEAAVVPVHRVGHDLRGRENSVVWVSLFKLNLYVCKYFFVTLNI